jgi:hypothetical protein
MTVDTLEYVKKLEAAGVPRPQAEAHAQAVRDTLGPQLATKADLDTAVARLETKIAELSGRVALVQWMLAFNLAATLGVFGLVLRMMLR